MIQIINNNRKITYSTDYYFFNKFSTEKKHDIFINSIGKTMTVLIPEEYISNFMDMIETFSLERDLQITEYKYEILEKYVLYKFTIQDLK